VQLQRQRDAAPEARVAITLAQAVLKADKMDDVVRDAVMIGVTAVQPLITARTEVSRAARERGARRDRWQRIAISSAKQCGRAVVPHILEVQTFDAALQSISGLRLPGPALMLVEPRAAGQPASIGDLDMTPPREATILVGPEGGWTDEEVASAATSCRTVTLGARTLRADAVAVIAVAALFTRWREF
jgi:16S rRNA (uracil1498-N3)-methyltransferase